MGVEIVILANILGLISAIVFWISNFKKTKASMTKLHLICNISDFLQYVLLDAPSAMANTSVTFFKNASYIVFKERRQKLFVILFGLLKMILMSLAYENILTAFMIIYEALSILALLKGKVKHVLLLSVVSSLIWMVYDFLAMAYLVSVLGVGSIISQVTAIYKHRGQLESLV